MKNIMTKYGPYPGDWPQQPHRPYEPLRSAYVGTKASKSTCIYQDFDYLNENVEENLEEYWGDQDEEIPQKPAIDMHSNLSLQDILDLAPSGADPKDIIIDISYPRYVDYIRLGFVHMKRDLTAEEAAYQKDMKKFQRELVDYNVAQSKYEKDLAAYQNWLKEQEVKELEEKLAKLKK